jgi:hypothetical protein
VPGPASKLSTSKFIPFNKVLHINGLHRLGRETRLGASRRFNADAMFVVPDQTDSIPILIITLLPS